jgi:hypothetical protein
MRKSTRNEGTHINYNNSVTQAIDAQPINAPQYGIVGKPPNDPTPPKNTRRRRNNRYLRMNKPSDTGVRQQRTKDLKLLIAILEAELALVASGQLKVSDNVRKAMESRLQVMRAEKSRRDLNDLAKGKITPNVGFFSLGARLARAA